MSKLNTRPAVGHTFLSKLGKTRLRPGGKIATDWLTNAIPFNERITVLEVACNKGTSIIDLVKIHRIHAVACDLDLEALEEAKHNAKIAGVSQYIQFIQADARSLPFEDASFDVVINEAMLTMLSNNDKEKAVQEYHRVLKENGMLLTHDVMLNIQNPTQQQALRKELSQEILANVQPLTYTAWLDLIEKNGFKSNALSGKMTLMSPVGMIRDEGLKNTLHIIRNALKPANRKRFIAMFKMFKTNKNNLGFIAIQSIKNNL